MTDIQFGSGTDIGHNSDQNEDSYFADPQLGLWLIADGMGGHEAGEVASAIVSETVCQAVMDGVGLVEAVRRAHDAVITASKRGLGAKGMGSTIIALIVKGCEYEIAWVGDSRAYIWNDSHCSGEDNNALQQISRDHSYVQKLLDTGAITQEEAINHPNKNIITQSLGAGSATVTVDSKSGQFSGTQKILLCSDGLSDELIDAEICDILQQGGDDQMIVDNLIRAALLHGGRDNITAILVSAPVSEAETETQNGVSHYRSSDNKSVITDGESADQEVIWMFRAAVVSVIVIAVLLIVFRF